MTKFKFRVTEETTIHDAEKALQVLKEQSVNEILLNDLLKIFEFLGIEQPRGRKSGTGVLQYVFIIVLWKGLNIGSKGILEWT